MSGPQEKVRGREKKLKSLMYKLEWDFSGRVGRLRNQGIEGIKFEAICFVPNHYINSLYPKQMNCN
jgi:hypothetical protein